MHAKLQELREKRENGDHGFTLIELLVVVVIIGVLVAIAIPLYLNYRKGAENKDAQSDVRNAVAAVESCYADNGNTYAGMVATNKATSTGGSISLTCSAGNTQTINISEGVVLTFDASAAPATAYTITGVYTSTASGHKQYTYSSATGKTT